MGNQEDIGKLFKNKLAHLDKSPSDALWGAIEQDLDKKRKKRFVFWLTFCAGIAIFIGVLGLTIPYYLETTKAIDNNKTPVTKTPLAKTKSTNSTPNEIQNLEENNKVSWQVGMANSDLNTKNKTNLNSEKSTVLIAKSGSNSNSKREKKNTVSNYGYPEFRKEKTKNKTQEETFLSSKLGTALENSIRETVENTTGFSAENTTTKNEILNTDKLQDSICNAEQKESKLVEKEATKETIPTEKQAIILKELQYKVGVYYGFAQLHSFSNQSIINASFDQLPMEHPFATTFGIHIKSEYKRYGIRLGISKINLTQKYQLTPQLLFTDTGSMLLNTPLNSLKAQFASATKPELDQEIAYLQFSTAFHYELLNSSTKFNIEAIGGFSFSSLEKNKLYLRSENIAKQEIGSVSNIRSATVSLDFGLGFKYQVSRHIQFDVNPITRFYFMPIQDNNNTISYSISIQTGFSYRF